MGSLETLRVANFSRAYGNSSLWEFGVEMLAPKSKMGSHFLASVLYKGFANLGCYRGEFVTL